MREQSGRRSFPTTHWSLVGRAGGNGSDSAVRRALGELLAHYLPAMRWYLVARRKVTETEADDLLQGFLVSKVLEQELVARADRERGKFRHYLMTALDRFAASEVRKGTALKRSAGATVGLDEEVVQDAALPERADLFDLAWARQALDLAMGRMRRECDDSGRPEVWGLFEARVVAPALNGSQPESYERLMPGLGLRSPEQAFNLLVTAKRMFLRHLREVVGEYAEDEAEVEQEIMLLKSVLSSARA